MSYSKRFTLWLTIFALTISVINILGYDDMGILLYITSPPAWYLNEYSSFLRRFLSVEEFKAFNYILHVGFWFILGITIDWLRKFKHAASRLKIGMRLGAIALLLILAFVSFKIFYAYQNSEQVIAHVITNFSEYSSDEVRYCVIWAARHGYGEKYINDIGEIVKKTNDPDVYGTSMMALSQLKDQQALEIIIENYDRFGDRYSNRLNLERNHKIIISMLSVNELPEQIQLAIKAARILRHIEYIEPLDEIASTTMDDELRQEILEVIDEIEKDPVPRNPKWDVD